MGTERARSIEQAIKGQLPVFQWGSINEEGAYVDMRSGTLYRVFQEALAPGHSPVIELEGRNSGPFARISDDPQVERDTARLVCKTYNLQASF